MFDEKAQLEQLGVKPAEVPLADVEKPKDGLGFTGVDQVAGESRTNMYESLLVSFEVADRKFKLLFGGAKLAVFDGDTTKHYVRFVHRIGPDSQSQLIAAQALGQSQNTIGGFLPLLSGRPRQRQVQAGR